MLRQRGQQEHNLLLLSLQDQLPAGWRLKAYHRHLHLIQNRPFGNDQRRSMSGRLPRFDWLDLLPVQPHQVHLMATEASLVQT